MSHPLCISLSIYFSLYLSPCPTLTLPSLTFSLSQPLSPQCMVMYLYPSFYPSIHHSNLRLYPNPTFQTFKSNILSPYSKLVG